MKGLKTIFVFFATLGLLVFAPGAWAQGILSTKHNLSNTDGTPASGRTIFTTGNEAAGTGTARVCVFCHTPHGADTAIAAPLWNRAETTVTSYTVYSSPTFDAGTAGLAPQPDGTSLACLSCHDGTVAFDALRNLPGSGGFDPTAPDQTWTWNTVDSMPAGITNIGEGTKGGTTADLSNDHPVSMLYANALSPSSASGTNDHATGFNDPTSGDPATDWYFANGVKISAGKVQCTSCHDPHRADTPTFLRAVNDGSALCVTCHRKNV